MPIGLLASYGRARLMARSLKNVLPTAISPIATTPATSHSCHSGICFTCLPLGLREFFHRHPVNAFADRNLDMLAVANISTNNADAVFPAHRITGAVGWRQSRRRCRQPSAVLAGLAWLTTG